MAADKKEVSNVSRAALAEAERDESRLRIAEFEEQLTHLASAAAHNAVAQHKVRLQL